MKTAIRMLSTVLLASLIVSCPLLQRDYSAQEPDDDIEIPDDGLGVLKIDFSADIKDAKSLLPPISMDIGGFAVNGVLDGGNETFSEPVGVGESFSKYGLTPGLWNITVDALNTDEPAVTIGRGTTTAQIYAGSVTVVQVMISPLPGIGTLDLTVIWAKKIFGSDSIDATLTPVLPAYAPDGKLTFDIKTQGQNREGTFSDDAIPAGYYLLFLNLIGDGVIVLPIVEAVRILDGQITSATFTYTP
jgi:hypothetical protein